MKLDEFGKYDKKLKKVKRKMLLIPLGVAIPVGLLLFCPIFLYGGLANTPPLLALLSFGGMIAGMPAVALTLFSHYESKYEILLSTKDRLMKESGGSSKSSDKKNIGSKNTGVRYSYNFMQGKNDYIGSGEVKSNSRGR